ncbi:MAG: hypothetical protein IIA64_11340 [Planctomycetes bacterium]|nr:hypothetical protein [Planctomycetota bacterium]
MSKTSFIIGLALASILHGAIFWLLLNPAATQPTSARPKPVSLRRPLPEPINDQVPTAENDPPRQEPQPDVLTGLTDIARPQVDQDRLTMRGDSPTDPSDESIPPLRIVWAGADELAAVARALGMKVVAVNGQNEIVGEVELIGRPQLLPFSGDLSGYSNRVRTLEPGFFGRELFEQPGVRIRSLWVLVPASHDAHFIELQRDALRRVGVHADAVRLMEARFEPRRGRTYQLSITHVHQKKGADRE